MAKRTFDEAPEERQRQESIRRFVESIPVKDVPQQEVQSPYPRIRRKKETESLSPESFNP